MTPVEPTELVAGRWQLRPWPAASADLDDVLAALHPGADLAALRRARLEGWARGDLLGFAVREITTGAAEGEALVEVDDGHARVQVHPLPGVGDPALADEVAAVLGRWAGGALGLRTG